MREIKFRALTEKTRFPELKQGMVYGTGIFEDRINIWLLSHDNKKCLADGFLNQIVQRDTIGQFTGLKDKNGKEIYEGDILDVKAGESGVFRYQVMWDEKQCGWRNQYGQKLPQLFGKPNSEVIGNIYENPELL